VKLTTYLYLPLRVTFLDHYCHYPVCRHGLVRGQLHGQLDFYGETKKCIRLSQTFTDFEIYLTVAPYFIQNMCKDSGLTSWKTNCVSVKKANQLHCLDKTVYADDHAKHLNTLSVEKCEFC
jgi:hypothetical protein